MPGQYDRLTVNATRPRDLALLATFRQLVGERGISPTLLKLIAAYVEQQQKPQEGRR